LASGDAVTHRPRVSVIIPAYNAEKFVLDAIRSVDLQEYPSVEVLLIDDGSRDGTVKLVQREAPWVEIIQQPNAGAAAARNTGLRHATSEFICFLDADDGWFPGKLDAQVDYLTRHPDVGAVYHDWLVWQPDEAGVYHTPTRPPRSIADEVDPTQSGWIYPRLLLDCIVHTSTVMMRREVALDVGEFETTLVTGEDYDYWLRLSRKCQIHKLTGTYSFYRSVVGSLTGVPKAENNEYRVLKRAILRWGLSSPDGASASRYLVRKRLGQLAFEFGYVHYHYGSRNLARNAFVQTLWHDPFRLRALVYLIASTFR
jgi:glycosyltransferase involved in cell wall biosynthesis